MKAVVQRVIKSSVEFDGEVVGEISNGVMMLLGIGKEDTEKDVDYLIKKVTELRIFEDENDKMNKSLVDINGEILVVSQFTLYGDCKKGRRPSYDNAAKPDKAKELYNLFLNRLKSVIDKVESGIFQAKMKVNIVNDGPVTLLIESPSSN